MAFAFVIALFSTPRLPASQPPAQPAVGTIRGTVYDSLGGGPLAGATVELANPVRVVTTDQRGNFTLDSVPVGVHRLVFSAPDLDSIGLFGFARDLDVRAGVQQVLLATPSFKTMYLKLCGPSKEAVKDSAIMFGTVYDARTRTPVRDAKVSFAWYAVDSLAGKQLVELVRQATTDDAGNYGRCGLPAELALRTSAVSATAASGPVSSVIGSAQVFRRDLYISDEFSNEAGLRDKPDSVASATRGTGIVRGFVRDEKGRPLTGALVVLLASDRTARTDSLGQYRFAGVPLGTQELSVRQVGRGALYRTIDLAGDAPLDVSFVLPEATVLSTVNVRGERRMGSDQAGFASRKRIGFGRFVEQSEIVKRFDMPSAIQRIPGLTVQRTMSGVTIQVTRKQCTPLIVIDGIPGGIRNGGSTIPLPGETTGVMPSPMEMRVETLSTQDVVAMEFYDSTDPMPLQYSFGDAERCGMLLIWTVFARW